MEAVQTIVIVALIDWTTTCHVVVWAAHLLSDWLRQSILGPKWWKRKSDRPWRIINGTRGHFLMEIKHRCYKVEIKFWAPKRASLWTRTFRDQIFGHSPGWRQTEDLQIRIVHSSKCLRRGIWRAKMLVMMTMKKTFRIMQSMTVKMKWKG